MFLQKQTAISDCAATKNLVHACLLRCIAVQAWRPDSSADPCQQNSCLGSSVTCLDFSPMLTEIFVAGHDNGACVFYSVHSSAPRWTMQVQCSSLHRLTHVMWECCIAGLLMSSLNAPILSATCLLQQHLVQLTTKIGLHQRYVLSLGSGTVCSQPQSEYLTTMQCAGH